MGIQKYPASNRVNFTMSGIQTNITRQTKQWRNKTHEENNQLIETNSELTQMLEDEHIKMVIIIVFCMFKMLSRDMENIKI